MTHSPYNRFNSLKILVHADRLKDIASGGLPFPIDWHIYPTNACNHTCCWCMFRQNGEQHLHPTQLTRELLHKAVNDAARTGARLVHFSGGGEPLLNPHTCSAIASASAAGLAVALSTNGSLLTPDVASAVDYLRVSLNAGTRETHLRINHAHDRRSDWDLIIANLKSVAKAKKKDIGLAFVVDHQNVDDIVPFCLLASTIGVDFVHIRPAFWYDHSLDEATRSVMPRAVQQCNEARILVADKLLVFSIAEKFDGFWTPKTYQRCHAVKTGIVLTATGDFAVCQDRTDLRFGSAYQSGMRFEDIWYSDEHRLLIDQITSPGTLDSCPRCVWNKRNEIIEEVFIKDSMRMDMI